MIFKVFYQESKKEAPRREATHSMFVEANAISEVREYLTENTPYMIEHITEISGEFLEYEKEQNPDFEVVKP
ncbi:DNA-dependent RNA polymerase auxiliary subunit epsilon family protein [Aerococcaceae bacterium DSM 111021]|nr:DNA-dependent RNA polymerase auxiliary subunit epsilon family protein [Aerococcaceae bacterium DSM 111021]